MNKLKLALEKDFSLFRRYLHGDKMIYGAWQTDLEKHLMQFTSDMEAGLIPVLLVSAHPQSGKSETVTDYMLWSILRNETCKVMYASISAMLGKRAIRKARRLLDSPHITALWGNIWGATKTSTLIEFKGLGSLTATTVSGASIGLTVDLAIIDDPCKNRADSLSLQKRTAVKSWFDNDLTSRLTKKAGILSIQTRWHVDDLYKHIETVMPHAKKLNYVAINEKGAALFPELKPIEFLELKRASMNPFDWESLYMGNPVVLGGELFDVKAIRYYQDAPSIFKERFIMCDLASTDESYSDYNVFAYFGITPANDLYLLDLYRKKLQVPEIFDALNAFWNKSKGCQYIAVENKSSGIGIIQSLKLKRFRVVSIERNKESKVTRALDVTPPVANGHFYMPEYLRNDEVISELAAFPNGKHDDFVDVLIDGLSALKKYTNVDTPTISTVARPKLYRT